MYTIKRAISSKLKILIIVRGRLPIRLSRLKFVIFNHCITKNKNMMIRASLFSNEMGKSTKYKVIKLTPTWLKLMKKNPRIIKYLPLRYHSLIFSKRHYKNSRCTICSHKHTINKFKVIKKVKISVSEESIEVLETTNNLHKKI